MAWTTSAKCIYVLQIRTCRIIANVWLAIVFTEMTFSELLKVSTTELYIYIYIYCHPNILCGLTREMLQAGIETRLIYIYIYIYDWFGWVLWHTNHYCLFNAKSSSYIYIKYIWFGLVGWGFMAYQPLLVISCQIFFIRIYQIYMIWFGWVLLHIKHCRLFDAKTFLYIYI